MDPSQTAELKSLAKGNTPTRIAALKLGRTPQAVQAKASELRVSLKPNNQSPTAPKRNSYVPLGKA